MRCGWFPLRQGFGRHVTQPRSASETHVTPDPTKGSGHRSDENADGF
jgi:hypothetical protein